MLDKNDWFSVTLRSYNEYYLMSAVEIKCRNYDTFKKIVESIEPILLEEEKNKQEV